MKQDELVTGSTRSPNATTNPLTAAALIYAIGAGITAGAGTRLVLQLILVGGFKYHPLQSPRSEEAGSLFLFAASPIWHWAIYAPAALRRSGSYLSGSLSGIEP